MGLSLSPLDIPWNGPDMEKSRLDRRSGSYDLSTISDEVYSNVCDINGYAVIINNFEFTDQKNLQGGAEDTIRLQDTFRRLKFDVKIFENQPKDAMITILKDFGAEDYTKHNMFACVLSSHGSDQSICGSDGKPAKLVDLMKDIINCRSLKGKPKLFFIDVCRTLTKNFHITKPKEEGDYMICFSTLEGKAAYMLHPSDKFEGSIFCKVLCDCLRQYGDEKALQDILPFLKTAMKNVKEGKQKVEILDTLTKKLWFIPERSTVNYTWVVAIDFGTSMSGFAYSTCDEFYNSPLSMFHKQCWSNEYKNRDTMKTASCLLLDNNKEHVAFGFDAQAQFARLQMETKHCRYHYFHNFKMSIYNQQESLYKLQVRDIQENLLPAKDVFSASIKAIRQEVVMTLASYYKHFNEKKIRWVLTVPAIWPDDAKLFMRECAQEAGLPWEQLLIALEPEAASIYCQFLAINRRETISEGFGVIDSGTKYVIVDVGGGTTDITVHEKERNGQLKELIKASGKNIGSSYINEKIMGMFEEIFGESIMNILKTDKPDIYLDLCWEIEAVKKTVQQTSTKEDRIAISYPAFDKLCVQERNQTIDEVIAYHNNSKNAFKVQLKDDKLLIQKGYIFRHFSSLVQLIVKEVKNTISANNVSLIILVGGFAECRYFKEQMVLYFQPKKVISLVDANLAVLKGAVLYGHKPTFINPRITKFTYGVQVLGRFNCEKHDKSRKEVDGWGNVRCRNAFDVIIFENENVHLGKIITKCYNTTCPNQKNMSLKFFTSNLENPLYTDDGSCRKIGEIHVIISNPSTRKRAVNVQFIFGDTEVNVKATGCNEEIKLSLG